MYKPLIYKDLDLSDRYLISDSGEILSKKTNKTLKFHINNEGYYQVCVSLGSRKEKKVIKVHIAVAYNFVDGYEEGLIVNHKNGNKLDNNSYNLEWITYKENTAHAIENKLMKPCYKKVKCNETGQIFDSLTQAGEWAGLKYGDSISDYLKKPNRKTAGTHPITGEKLTWTLLK